MKRKILFLVVIIAFIVTLIIPQTAFANDFTTSIDKEFTSIDNSTVTKIPNGSTIIYYKTGITEVRDSQDKLFMRVNDSNSKQVTVPREKVSATHVFEVPDGSTINLENDGRITVLKDGTQLFTVASYKRMEDSEFVKRYGGTIKTSGLSFDNISDLFRNNTIKPPLDSEKSRNPNYLNDLYGQHVENAYAYNVDNLKKFTAYWNVPNSPTSPYLSTVSFLWNGVEDDYPQTDVIQPVLRYMYHSEISNYKWDCLAFYGIDGTYFYSEAIEASVGNEIKGIVNYGPLYWNCSIFNDSTGLGRSITVTGNIDDLSQNAYLLCELEALGVFYNSQMPGDTTFFNMSFLDNNNQNIDISWNSWVQSNWLNSLSGLSVTSPSDSTVYLNTAN